jgi:uncharacterized membrane protein YciS (DUF1049 family)
MIDLIANVIKSTSKDTIKSFNFLVTVVAFCISLELGIGILIGIVLGGVFTLKVASDKKRK